MVHGSATWTSATVWQEGACLTVKVTSQSVKGLVWGKDEIGPNMIFLCVANGYFSSMYQKR